MVRPLLDAYLNQALADEQSREVEEHLNQCDECFRHLTQSMELLADLEDPELERMVLDEPPPLPDDFTAQVMQRVEAERPRRVNVIWPWLRRNWSRRQFASVAYAMSATMVVVSAGNLLFLWNESTNRLAVWGAQIQAYWIALQASLGPVAEWFSALWNTLLHLG